MARTRIVIEVESTNVAYVKSLGNALVGYTRYFIEETRKMAHVGKEYLTVRITHDGKNVTEVIQ